MGKPDADEVARRLLRLEQSKVGWMPSTCTIYHPDGTVTVKDNPPPKPPRKPANRRFADVAVGDYLIKERKYRLGERLVRSMEYSIVTDLWFDPVKGEEDRQKGDMVAIATITRGRTFGKQAHTLRGLASNGWKYFGGDPFDLHDTLVEAVKSERVVGIGQAHIIRKRPKISMPTL